MSRPNADQIEYWNGKNGEKWVALQDKLDRMLAPVTGELAARVGNVKGKRVLDIGCGTGETCTRWRAAGAEVTGVDISAPMLALAAERTGGKVTLEQADAALWKAPRPFDVAVSRFGVMFFDAPEAAFANIASNLRPGGRLVFACWRAPKENSWVTVPMAAIKDLLPDTPKPDPHAPGPFALADSQRLAGILTDAGFDDVEIQPCDYNVYLSADGGVDAAVDFATRIGPTASALTDASPALIAGAKKRLRDALAPHEKNGAVALGGAIWIVVASLQ